VRFKVTDAVATAYLAVRGMDCNPDRELPEKRRVA